MKHNGGMAVGPQESVLAPRFSRVISVFIVVICALTEIALVAYGQLEPLLRATPAVLFVGYGTYALFWAPLIRVNPVAIEIVNPLRTTSVRWPAVTDITTRWSLTVFTAAARFTAWSSPSEGPWSSLGRLNRDVFGRPSMRPADRTKRPGSPIGVPSIVINQWESHRDGELPSDSAVIVRWHWPTIAVLSALVVLTIIGIAWS
jgi:hypothetical protein